jgi:hypothetical protein
MMPPIFHGISYVPQSRPVKLAAMPINNIMMTSRESEICHHVNILIYHDGI